MSAARPELSTRGGKREARALVAALTFLTRVPLGAVVSVDGDDVARAGPAFPLVGAAIGAVVGGSAAGLAHVLSPLLAAAVAVTLGAALTGALHLDALADTVDALGAGSRTRALEVMRDHAVGAYGAVAIALDLLLRVAALTALLPGADAVRFAVAAGALSRAAAVLLAAELPYARAGGTAAPLMRGGRPRALVAAAIAAAVAVGSAGLDGLALLAAAAAATALAGAFFRRWLGGVTGDTLGAASELSEIVVLVGAVALVGAR